MLTCSELPLCLSFSSLKWSVCWRGDHHHCGMGLFGSTRPFASVPITLNSEHVSHTPHSRGEEEGSRKQHCLLLSCCVSWALWWQCVGSARMQHPDAGSRGIPLLTQGQARGICSHIPVKPEARLRLQLWCQMNYMETAGPVISLLKNNLRTSATVFFFFQWIINHGWLWPAALKSHHFI